MILILAFILFFLMVGIGGERGVASFITLILNTIAFFAATILLANGWNSFAVTFISCLFISIVSLFYQNGRNVKTAASFVSVVVILLVLFLFVFRIGLSAHIQGFAQEKIMEDEMIGYSENIDINMMLIEISVIIIGLTGAILDTSVAISSAVYEVYMNNKHLKIFELFESGLNIGRDILGTTINTLFFAYVGEFMTLLLLFKSNHYSWTKILNSKVFAEEFISIVFSGLGCIFIIPLTAAIASLFIFRYSKVEKSEPENIIKA